MLDPMHLGLDGILATQHGIFARHQAIACGVTSRQFSRLAGSDGPWIKVRYGVYTTRERWSGLTSHDRLVLRDRAALLVCESDAVLSHSSAARVLGLPLYAVPDQHSHVTRTTLTQTARVQAQVKHHVATLPAAHVMTLAGARVTSPERTVLDLAREYGFFTGVVAADAALNAGADSTVLTSMVEALTTEPGGPEIAAAVANARVGADTPIETLGRIILVRLGIDDLVLQHVIPFPDGGQAVGDIYSPTLNHLWECDGRVKYQTQDSDLSPEMSADHVVWLEKKREDRIRSLGIGISRLVWSDVQPNSFERTAQRLRREIQQQSGGGSWLPPAA